MQQPSFIISFKYFYKKFVNIPANTTEPRVTVVNPPTNIVGTIVLVKKSFSSSVLANTFIASLVNRKFTGNPIKQFRAIAKDICHVSFNSFPTIIPPIAIPIIPKNIKTTRGTIKANISSIELFTSPPITPTTDATTKKPKQLAFCNDFLSNHPISPATIPNNNANIVGEILNATPKLLKIFPESVEHSIAIIPTSPKRNR